MKDQKPAVAIVGAGALGTVLALRLVERGYAVEAVASRTLEKARDLAARVGAPVAGDALRELPPSIPVIICCVPDDVIGEVAELLSEARPDWTGSTVVHTSGALPASALGAVGRCGAKLLSFHPLQTFTRDTSPEAFEGISIGVEGEAVAFGARLASDLGGRPLILQAEAKARYHLAASMASNFLVTLMALAGEVLTDAGIDRREGAQLLRPLVERTWQNLLRALPEEALTGPIARGDRDTVGRHLAALSRHLPHLVPVYAALGAETVRLAREGRRLSAHDAAVLLDQLHEALETVCGDRP